jgi:hypoxanthine phosphoribosyltransferase
LSASGVSAEQAAAVLDAADRVLDRGAVDAAYARLAAAIHAGFAGRNPLVLVCMVGGMIPAVALLSRLDIALELDYVHATRYRGGTTGHDVQWRVRPSRALAGRHVLVVDDILDEGYTLSAILDAARAAGAASVRSAVLVEKRHGRRAPGLVADFVGAEVPDRYVFGCGMDYKGWHRQLPAIYAVADTAAGP